MHPQLNTVLHPCSNSDSQSGQKYRLPSTPTPTPTLTPTPTPTSTLQPWLRQKNGTICWESALNIFAKSATLLLFSIHMQTAGRRLGIIFACYGSLYRMVHHRHGGQWPRSGGLRSSVACPRSLRGGHRAGRRSTPMAQVT